MRERPYQLLILGLGNVLCADDGLGVAAVTALKQAYEPPAGVEIVDGGTLGLALLPWIEDADRVILVDAVMADAPPGSLVRLEGDDVGAAVAHRLSPHQIGVADLLDGARLRDRYPPLVVLLGLVPERFDLRLGCSHAVAQRLPALVDEVALQAARLGYPLSHRNENETRSSVDPRDASVVLGL